MVINGSNTKTTWKETDRISRLSRIIKKSNFCWTHYYLYKIQRKSVFCRRNQTWPFKYRFWAVFRVYFAWGNASRTLFLLYVAPIFRYYFIIYIPIMCEWKKNSHLLVETGYTILKMNKKYVPKYTLIFIEMTGWTLILV